MICLNTNGLLDDGSVNDSTPSDSFGAGGIVVSDFSPTNDPPYQGMIQFDPICACEKIIALGMPEINGVRHALAAHYLE